MRSYPFSGFQKDSKKYIEEAIIPNIMVMIIKQKPTASRSSKDFLKESDLAKNILK
jgi:hypothetical protein